ncbi:MAG: hypothetical protein COA78_36005 [Blastopirellula sp.]|nr:MAG: hypothetical protein COA78_36005 [Blastopirellula sp.]
MNDKPIIFLDRHAAEVVSQHEPYRLACHLFHCGLIDRTETLDLGFEAQVIDPLCDVINGSTDSVSFSKICDHRADAILEEAISTNRRVQVLWSGGIDSTVMIIALMQKAEFRNCKERLQILCSIESISEYRTFFYKYIWQRYEVIPVGYPISNFISSDALIVTGEHGDQLYGSDFLEPYVRNGLAFESWQTALPFALAANELSGDEATVVQDYLEPLMKAAPVPIISLFDFFWWLNFSLKWQSVALRIPANTECPQQIFEVTRHFFRHQDFQRWSLHKHERTVLNSWSEYKMPSKQYIYEFTGDKVYRTTKVKEQSLRLIFAGESTRRRKTQRRKDIDDPQEKSELTSCGLVLNSHFSPIFITSA